MENMRYFVFTVFVILVIVMYLALTIRQVGLLPFWTMVEYMQLISFIPLYNFRLIPYIYDAFKPFLISHLILTDDYPFFRELKGEYFNRLYRFFDLDLQKMLQSIINFFIIALIMVVLHAVFWILQKNTRFMKPSIEEFVVRAYKNFKWNVYIKIYMLAYANMMFFSVQVMVKGDTSTPLKKNL